MRRVGEIGKRENEERRKKEDREKEKIFCLYFLYEIYESEVMEFSKLIDEQETGQKIEQLFEFCFENFLK